jgi:hypothetical protein
LVAADLYPDGANTADLRQAFDPVIPVQAWYSSCCKSQNPW